VEIFSEWRWLKKKYVLMGAEVYTDEEEGHGGMEVAFLQSPPRYILHTSRKVLFPFHGFLN
jgi:hypothetical protein